MISDQFEIPTVGVQIADAQRCADQPSRPRKARRFAFLSVTYQVRYWSFILSAACAEISFS